MADPRVYALRDILRNIVETPADQDDDFLADAANICAQIKGSADTERLRRAMTASLTTT